MIKKKNSFFEHIFFKKYLIISLILFFGLIKGIVFITIVPDFMAPDESSYFHEIKVVAEEHKIPGITTEKLINHPPLYYVVSYPFYSLGSLWGEIGSVFAIRFFGIVLLTGIGFIAFLVSKELFPDNTFVHFATPTLIMLNPQLTFINGSINSDSLLNFFFALLFWQTTLAVKRGLTIKRSIFILLLIIGGIYTKERFIIALYSVVILVFLLLLRSLWNALKPRLSKYLFSQDNAKYYYIFIATLLIMFSGVNFFSKSQFRVIVHAYDPGFNNGLFKQFWGYFGWLDIQMGALEYELINWIPVLATVGLVIAFFKFINKNEINIFRNGGEVNLVVKSKKGSVNTDNLIIYLYFISSIGLSFLAVSYYDIFGAGSQGRYLFIIAIPYFIFISAGLSHFVPDNLRKYLFIFLFCGLLALNFVALFNYIIPFYY